jgi:hypothetical protein
MWIPTVRYVGQIRVGTQTHNRTRAQLKVAAGVELESGSVPDRAEHSRTALFTPHSGP